MVGHADLGRFVAAQSADYAQALSELRAGRKRGHWIWYVLPQLRGLGRSPMSYEYGLAGAGEAAAYLAHPLLGPRLRECVAALIGHADEPVEHILGPLDAMKCRSCLTLFAAVSPEGSVFHEALDRLFDSRPDPMTLERLAGG